MKKIKLTKAKIITGILVVILLATGYLAIYYHRDLIFGPSVLFIGDNNIEINLYPNEFQMAFVFTIDDAHKLTNPQKVRNVVDILNKFDVKGVFFVIPYYKGRYKLTNGDEITTVLRQITKEGHEIGQHGLTHSLPRKKLKIFNPTKEFVDLPYGEQKRRIYVGKKILEEAGFQINGFRSPAFSANYNTLKILDSYDFLYGANVAILPPPFMMANKRFAESIYYPFHPEDLNLIEFISHGDYFRTYFNAKNFLVIRKRFKKIYDKQGIFILITHIESLSSTHGLALLNTTLEYVATKNVWKPNLIELALWWKGREALFAESEIDNNILKIVLKKGNEFELNGLTIKFKKGVKADDYEIIDDDGSVIKKGKIIEKVVTINY